MCLGRLADIPFLGKDNTKYGVAENDDVFVNTRSSSSSVHRFIATSSKPSVKHNVTKCQNRRTLVGLALDSRFARSRKVCQCSNVMNSMLPSLQLLAVDM